MSKLKKILVILIYIVLTTLIICSVNFLAIYYYDVNETNKQNILLNEISIDKNVITGNNEQIQTEGKDKEIKTERMLKLEELKKENNDIIGWIEIENTNINYPVLQGSDNDFYVRHNYKKAYSMSGSIFLDKNYSWNPPSSNLLIYGHNMKNGTMFQNLLKYKNKNFYDEHPIIRFTTTNEDANYEIIAVFESKVYYKTEKNAFRYYYFINAQNKEEYDQFIKKAKDVSLYDTGKTAQYGEQLITLSTCAYHTKDGRFVVVAKKISN